MSPKLETVITGGATIAAIVAVGAVKTAGWIDEGTATLAIGVAVGGGLGWAGKTATTAPA
jgi:hypothetical protein